MAKRRKILLLFACGLVLLLCVVFWSLFGARPEPIYKGVRLSDWVAKCDNQMNPPEQNPEIVAAMNYFGTNALPYLIEWMKSREPDWRLDLRRKYLRLTNRYLPVSTQQQLGVGAGRAIAMLGTNVAPAIPFFVQSLKDEDFAFAGRCAVVLGQLHQEPRLVVPALTQSFQDSRPFVIHCSAVALGYFKEDARSAVPVLVSALASTNKIARMAATNALLQIDPEALKRATGGVPP